MTASPDSLAPQFRDDPKVEPPYSNAQISETAIHREILRIYNSARRETRVIYDLGRDTDRIEEENWVIRWMLWHVFRYRDSRNRNRRTASPGDGDSGSGPSSEPGSTPTNCKMQYFINGSLKKLTFTQMLPLEQRLRDTGIPCAMGDINVLENMFDLQLTIVAD